MVRIQENISLKPFNSFGVQATARWFCCISSEADWQELIQMPLYRTTPRLLLGGGSNILFTRNFDGLVIKCELKGIEVIDQSDESIDIRVASGETWHELVMHCVDCNWGGLENLSLIPGTVGAAPIQNIGAYGVEVAELIRRVDGWYLSSGARVSFDKQACRFGYRESVFKSDLKEKIFISSVTLTLRTKNHRLNVGYGALQDTLKQMRVTSPSIRSVSDAVIRIRSSKLPDYKVVGNAGSFFKNPTLTKENYNKLLAAFPSMPSYPADHQSVKVPAAWLIEQCGWKGKTINHVGVHPHQALVLVNYGGGSGEEILRLSEQIQSSVKERFHIELTPEVNVIT